MIFEDQHADLRPLARPRQGSLGPQHQKGGGQDVGEQGITRVRFTVDARGHVSKIKITQSSGYQRLDDVAISRISRCTYPPVRGPDGHPAETTQEVDVDWRLD